MCLAQYRETSTPPWPSKMANRKIYLLMRLKTMASYIFFLHPRLGFFYLAFQRWLLLSYCVDKYLYFLSWSVVREKPRPWKFLFKSFGIKIWEFRFRLNWIKLDYKQIYKNYFDIFSFSLNKLIETFWLIYNSFFKIKFSFLLCI